MERGVSVAPAGEGGLQPQPVKDFKGVTWGGQTSVGSRKRWSLKSLVPTKWGHIGGRTASSPPDGPQECLALL
jgi:hypothetical protein